MTGYVISFMLGGFIGMLAMCLVSVAREEDRK
ncbi:MAG: DUF3789 domain-containing protein [Oscillospiraceae bacterium]|nr:DUF3789 domain-containing protein [Oscillospiraceae bacterium]